MINILMNTSMIDEKWCRPVFSKVLKPGMKVCVAAITFFDDTKNEADWNRQYACGQGIWYRANHDVFFRYGIRDEDISWIHYFTDTKEEMRRKIEEADVLMLTGGAPDLAMKRIREKGLKKTLKNFSGIVIGYSAGAMMQLDRYHITPDPDYPEFSWQNGLGYVSGIDIEVHYMNNAHQNAYIEKVRQETGKPVYAIYEDGCLMIDEQKKITCFGRVDLFE